MITKGNVQFMVHNGMMDLTAHTLDAAHAYKVVKFKNVLREANRGIDELDKKLYEELGIDDAFINKFNEFLAKEKLTKKEEEEFAKMKETDKKLGDMRDAMLNEVANLDEVKAMPYAEWKKLQDENKNLQLIYRDGQGQVTGQREILMAFEEQLENVLWVAPEE